MSELQHRFKKRLGRCVSHKYEHNAMICKSSVTYIQLIQFKDMIFNVQTDEFCFCKCTACMKQWPNLKWKMFLCREQQAGRSRLQPEVAPVHHRASPTGVWRPAHSQRGHPPSPTGCGSRQAQPHPPAKRHRQGAPAPSHPRQLQVTHRLRSC